MAKKKVYIYGSSVAFGHGAAPVSEDTLISEESQDKIRWQNESLWPAYENWPSALTRTVEPVRAHVDMYNASRVWRYGLGPRRIQYARRKIHEIRPRTDLDGDHMAVFNENTDFGERNELYDLYIDLGELIREYSTTYGLARDDFPPQEDRGDFAGGEQQGDNFGPQAILKPKFAKFLQDIYGIVCLPYVDTQTSRPSRLIPGEGYTTEVSEQFDTGFFRRYEDHTTAIDGLIDVDPLLVSDDISLPPETPYARIDKRYNSVFPDYENALHEDIVPNNLTRLIPNIYLLEEIKITTPADIEELRRLYALGHEPALLGALRRIKDVEDFVRLGGLIKADSLLRDYFCAWTGAVNEIVPFDAGVEDRFRQHADAVKALLSKQFGALRLPIFSHLFIAPEERAFYSEAARKADQAYPLYNRISFKPLSGYSMNSNAGVAIVLPSAGNKIRRLGLSKYFARFITMMPQRGFDYYSIVTNQLLYHVPVSYNLLNHGLKLRSIDMLRLILTYNHPQRDLRPGQDYENYLYQYDAEANLQKARSLIVLGRGTDGHLAEEEFDIAPSREGNELVDDNARSDLVAWLRTKISQKLRTYEQILNGQQAQSEVVLYRVEKRLNNQVVQDFLIPNTDDLGSIFEYFDTQIVPGTPGEYVYTYNIYATYLVIGNEYRRNIWAKDPQSGRSLDRWNFPLRPRRSRGAVIHERTEDLKPPTEPNSWPKRWYSNMPMRDQHDRNAELDDARSFVDAGRGSINLLDVGMDYRSSVPGLEGKDLIRIGLLVNNRPSVRMIETLVCDSLEYDTFSKPPLPPNVDFYPLKGVNNELLINMSMFVDMDSARNPISFNEGERDLFRRVRNSQIQQRFLTGEQIRTGKVLFSNDDFPSSYEVYRLQEPPSSYEGFTDALHYFADLEDEDDVPTANAHMFADFLVPNNKYYYTFRSKDVHSLVSNPSPVYQVELVDNQGAVYLLVETYNFPEEKQTYTKGLQQYLKISPSIIQSEINKDWSGLVDRDGNPASTAFEKEIFLGPEADPVWNKKLKFRITSKKTGRKIDINVDFKTKVDTTRDVNDLGCPPLADPEQPPAPPAPEPPPARDDRRDEAGDFLVGAAPAGGDDIQVGLGGQAAAEPEPEPQSERDQHREAREEAEREEAIRRAADWDPNAGEWEDYE